MAIHVACPHCSERLQFDESLQGAMLRCRSCNRPFTAPQAPTPAAPAAWGLQANAPTLAARQSAPAPLPPTQAPWQPGPQDYGYPQASNPLPWILVGILAFILIAIAALGMMWWAWDVAAHDDMHDADVQVHIAQDQFKVDVPVRDLDFNLPEMVPPQPPDVMKDFNVPNVKDFNVPNVVDPLAVPDVDEIRVPLEKGRYEADHRLGDLDPLDAIHNQPRKLFTVELKAGRRYVIEMASKEFTCYLRVDGTQGRPLDVGVPAKDVCRLAFAPEHTSRYQIIASRFDGRGAFHLSIREEP